MAAWGRPISRAVGAKDSRTASLLAVLGKSVRIFCRSAKASAFFFAARFACARQYKTYSCRTVSPLALANQASALGVRFFWLSSKPSTSAARAPHKVPEFFAAKAPSFSYAPGVAVCRARANSESCWSAAESSAVGVATSGAEVSGLQPARHGTAGFLALRFLDDWAEEGSAKASERKRIDASAKAKRSAATRDKYFKENLMLADGSGVGIFAERARVAFGKDFNHPAVKIIHRVIHDGFEASVVFAMSFLNVVFQSDADIFVFAAQANLIRPQHFNILHGNFRHSICTPV